MTNLGHYIDRNPNLRAAGLSSYKTPEDMYGAKECCVNLHIGEEAENQILAHCRRLQPKPYGKRTPMYPKKDMQDQFDQHLRKEGPFSEGKENLFHRKSALGHAMETYSKPDTVTNISRTFGRVAPPEESVYSIILPQKTVEQVNREYADFHDQHILSHNHYFPAEQINRRYTEKFNRFDTFGVPTHTDYTGSKVKNCLHEGEEHLKIIKKPKMDLDDRTKAPLGRKFNWYPYVFPKNMTFGLMSQPNGNIQSLLEQTSLSSRTNQMTDAISHINKLRNLLQRRYEFNINDLIVALQKKDTEGTRLLPLAQIIQIMRNMNIPADAVKIRTAASHFHLFVDENCCGERVKYEDLCDLLSIQKPLPLIGSISPLPETMYNSDTTYGQMCADSVKKPPQDRVNKHPHRTPIQEDMNNTRVVDVINPDPTTLCGLWPSDFKKARAKDEMERIFEGYISKEDFDLIWQGLMDNQEDSQKMASIRQFREEMRKK
ncbi:EF-hand domain-containing family member B [Drosophila kikkawai]|uniref:EF-hand domain-containing family member B n=1 Tax=Drosophila kikkawai TaxID=30033 RepID=A0A6P4IB99_DROKI|nr:EF-hand domain-containing family member B [Drosophila kikkawai]